MDAFLPGMKAAQTEGRDALIEQKLAALIERLPDDWPTDFCAFHTPAWWRQHWERSRAVAVEHADHLPHGRDLWLRWNHAIGATQDAYLTAPAGANLGIHRVVGRRVG